jgi:predicted metal-dependent hydrolase
MTAMEVVVIRSAKRRKTSQARLVDGCLEVRIPARLSVAEEQRVVADFRRRFERSHRSARVDLTTRACRLADAHDLPRPGEIRWVANQGARWGSCTPSTGTIRISDRLAAFPPWVLDAVIVHELAHLCERGHGPAFRALVARYRLAERAEGYLIARSGETEPTADVWGDDDQAGSGAATDTLF